MGCQCESREVLDGKQQHDNLLGRREGESAPGRQRKDRWGEQQKKRCEGEEPENRIVQQPLKFLDHTRHRGSKIEQCHVKG